MLKVQEYLREGGTLEELKENLGIKAVHHETLPLVILSYSQIDSPKTDPIVRECRGLVLEKGTWDLVAKAFDRFFNLTEIPEEDEKFVWDGAVATEKHDGTLILVYNYRGHTMINTRQTFGNGVANSCGKTWRELVVEAMGDLVFTEISEQILLRETLVFELCGPHNRIVREYPKPELHLIGRFIGPDEVHIRDGAPLDLCPVHSFNVMSQSFLKGEVSLLEEMAPTHEGFVVRDKNGMRLKVKTETYYQMHKFLGQTSDRNLVYWILRGEQHCLLDVFPHVKDRYDTLDDRIYQMFLDLLQVYRDTKNIESRKELAQAIIKRTPFSGIIFRRRDNNEEGVHALWKRFRESDRMILKQLGIRWKETTDADGKNEEG